MRILIALADKDRAKRLSSVFTRTGAVIEAADGNDPGEMADYINYPGAPFDLLVHEPDAPAELASKIPARLTVERPGTPSHTASLHTLRPHDNDAYILRKAYTAIALSKNFSAHNILEFGPLALDLWNHSVAVNGTLLKTTPREYKALRILCLNRGRFVSTAELVDQLYPADAAANDPANAIKQTFFHLRRKISAANHGHDLIVNHNKMGYIIDDPAIRPFIKKVDIGSFILTPEKGVMAFGDEMRRLPPVESRLLETLANGRKQSWGSLVDSAGPTRASIQISITRLRRKMVDLAGYHHIETIWGEGVRVSPQKIYPESAKPAPEAR